MLTINECVSNRCNFALDPASNQVVPLSDALISRLSAKQRRLAAQGQRVILLTQKIVNRLDLPKGVDYASAEFAEFVNTECRESLIVVGLLGLVDPPKEDVPETIQILRGAYIRCFMVTGDFASSEYLSLQISHVISAECAPACTYSCCRYCRAMQYDYGCRTGSDNRRAR